MYQQYVSPHIPTETSVSPAEPAASPVFSTGFPRVFHGFPHRERVARSPKLRIAPALPQHCGFIVLLATPEPQTLALSPNLKPYTPAVHSTLRLSASRTAASANLQ